MGIGLLESGFAKKVIGVDKQEEHLNKALRRKIIDEAMDLDAAMAVSDVIIIATPVDTIMDIVPMVLDRVDKQVVMDVGSTKKALLDAIADHPKRKRFVATHPMAGTEFSGPEAAIPDLFTHKCTVICDEEDSDADAVKVVKDLYTALKMNILHLEAAAHDVHAAYVSHISHITSFALALTVLEKEKDEARIFDMASGGFSSTVRLAKSNPKMWVPIFKQNRDNVLDVLDEHISVLSQFRSLLIKNNFDTFEELICKANEIERILETKTKQ